MQYSQFRSKAIGCILAGAAGDALGYAVEFLSYSAIMCKFGNAGITDYVPEADGLAVFSDDTQMTLFTAEGIMEAFHSGEQTVENYINSIARAYLRWYKTQTKPFKPEEGLLGERRLWEMRAPGNTCMSALHAVGQGLDPINNSKGCGSIMRVAPVGIFSASHRWLMSEKETALIAAGSGEITHLNKVSSVATAIQALIVREAMLSEETNRRDLKRLIQRAAEEAVNSLDIQSSMGTNLLNYLGRAYNLAESSTPDFMAISELGQGWVAEESLAIAVFSALRHCDSIEKALICASNHDGDSDSTAAIAGNILGAYLGVEAIPSKFIDTLELVPLMENIAVSLLEQPKEI